MMHPSYFLLMDNTYADSDKELSLPEEVSEWLFYIAFWEEFNKAHQTEFAQYEEDVLPKNLTFDLNVRIRALVDHLAGQSETEVCFLYGWDGDGVEIYCTVSRASLNESLMSLLEFLERAMRLGSEVYCQL